MSLKQIGILTHQLLASSMLENGLAIPSNLRAEIGDKPGPIKRRRTAERPSQQEIEAGCDAVARQCQRPPPDEDPNFGNVNFSMQEAVIAQQRAFAAKQTRQREEQMRKLEAQLKTPPAADAPPGTGVRLELELRKLQVVPLQQEIRRKIRDAMQRQLNKTNMVDYSASRVHRKSSKAHLSSKQKKHQREMQQQQRTRKETKKSRLNQELVERAKDFKQKHTEAAMKQRRMQRSVAAFHTQREREERKRQADAEKKRIRALKDNDEGAYMKLLEDTKNDRLLTLVQETDAALYSLGARIKAHKKETLSEEGLAAVDAAAKPGASGSDSPKAQADGTVKVHPDLLKTKEAYYQVTHTVTETLDKQPASLAGGNLKEYQLKGLEWLVSLYNNGLNGILADEMGLGKTIQTIALLCHVMDAKKNSGPFLVVVPNSTLPNWSNEFEQWAPHMDKVVYKGTKNSRKTLHKQRVASGSFNVLITTYEYVMTDKAMLSKTKWKYIIVDEGHRIKNHKSKLSMVLGSQYIAKNRLLLTGTPLHNNLPELWSLLNFLLPDIFSNVNDFESWFNAPFEHTGQKAEMTEEEELLVINRLHQVLRPFLLRRLKSEVMAELPQKVEKVIRCDISGWQTHLYKRVLQGKGIYTNNVNGTGRSGIQMMNNDLMQLRKICNHPHIFFRMEDEIDEGVIMASGKVHMLDRILPKLKAAGHRVLIFSQMTQLMDIAEDYFELRDYKYLRLDGATSVDERAEKMRLFQEDGSDYFIFMLSTRAGGMGINLQTADTVIIFDSDWNPQMDKQAQDRAHRIGQTHEVRVLRFVTAGTVEVAILNQARAKDDIDKKVIQAGKFNSASTDSERRKELEKVVLAGTDLVHDDDGPPNEEQLNEMLARDEAELVLYEKVGKEMKVPALGEEQDIPAWVIIGEADEDRKIEEKEEAEEAEAGRGHRKRKEVTYTDNDEEFDRILRSESEDDSQSESESDEGPAAKRAKSQDGSSGRGRGRGRGRGSRGSRGGRASSSAADGSIASRGRGRGRGRGRPRGRGRGRGRAKAESSSSSEEMEEAAEADDTVCMTCGRGDDEDSMVLCDGCDNARHMFCCKPPLSSVPDDDWFCGACPASKEKEKALTSEDEAPKRVTRRSARRG